MIRLPVGSVGFEPGQGHFRERVYVLKYLHCFIILKFDPTYLETSKYINQHILCISQCALENSLEVNSTLFNFVFRQKLEYYNTFALKRKRANGRYFVKGTVARDFKPLVFFSYYRPHMDPWFTPSTIFEFSFEITKIFETLHASG